MASKVKIEHTPEPWEVDASDSCQIRQEDWGGIGLVYNEPAENSALMHIARANAKRIVACVNGCKGINPDAVKDMRCAVRYCVGFLTGQHSNTEADRLEVLEIAEKALAKSED